MNLFKKGLCCLSLLVSCTWIASAADVDGILMDKMCSMKALKEGQKAAAMHTRDCALMPDCEKSGFGVFTSDNKYLTFDAAGNEKALKALKATKKKDDIKVHVTGTVEGDTIKVASLKIS